MSVLDKTAPNIISLCLQHKRMILKLHVKEQSKFTLKLVITSSIITMFA